MVMIKELLERWRCPHCGYITFIKPYNKECPACVYDHEYWNIEKDKKEMDKMKRSGKGRYDELLISMDHLHDLFVVVWLRARLS